MGMSAGVMENGVFPAADRCHRVETEVRANEGAGDPVKATSKSGGSVAETVQIWTTAA